MINYSSMHLLEVTSCAVFVADLEVFKGIEMEQIKELMVSPVVVDCKNMFDKGSRVAYLGIGKDE